LVDNLTGNETILGGILMQYRFFGKLDWKGSALGFGTMRLPILDNDSSKIDEPEAIRMIRHAIDQGVNYVDSAYSYHGGNSEKVTGMALQDGYRERVKLATKLPVWLVENYESFDKLLNEQLTRLQTDHIDFYLLHALSAERWPKMKALNVLDWLEKTRADGRIRHVGFSFHDNLDVFKSIIDDYESWEFCQIQYNYMDVENQAGTEGLKYAASKGLGVVVMEPLLGGELINPPDLVKSLWDSAAVKRSPADWALQWIWDQPEVSLVLSGMSTMEQVEQNIASAAHAAVGSITPDEQQLIDQVRTAYKELTIIPCTHCEYCLPCPNEINIPNIFSMFNQGRIYKVLDTVRDEYQRFVPDGKRADDCLACRECESKCPQHIPISDWMVLVDQVLARGVTYAEALKNRPV